MRFPLFGSFSQTRTYLWPVLFRAFYLCDFLTPVISFNPYDKLPRSKDFNLFYSRSSKRLSNFTEVTGLISYHCFFVKFSIFHWYHFPLCHFFLDYCCIWVTSWYCSNGLVWPAGLHIPSSINIWADSTLYTNVRY